MDRDGVTEGVALGVVEGVALGVVEGVALGEASTFCVTSTLGLIELTGPSTDFEELGVELGTVNALDGPLVVWL